MQKSLFSRKSPGKLVRIERNGGKDWAFIPDLLPVKWTFPQELWPELMQARETLAALNATAEALVDHELLLRPLQSREAIASSNMEGTSVTAEELLAFDVIPQVGRADVEKRADLQEVSNYRQALRDGTRSLAEQPFSNAMIRGLHATLMEGVRGQTKSPGRFRQRQVQIGTSARFVPPPAGEISRLMSNLADTLRGAAVNSELNVLVLAFLAHYQFETIHPFEDGNGRVGRVILALSICRWLGHAQPWLYLSAYFEKHKDEYVEGLFRSSTQGAWTEWIAFCLRATIAQAGDSLDRCRRFKALRVDFQQRVKNPSSRTFRIIDGLFSNPLITAGNLAHELQVTFHTADSDLQKLVQHGILEQLPERRPRTYVCRQIMQIAYADELPPLKDSH